MDNKKTFLAIIPARGGSKRLPKKNKLKLIDKPLIAWTIEAGLASLFIDELIVSTDDLEIKSIAETFGAKAPFLRPESIAGDNATTIDVVKHVVTYYSNLGKHFDFIVLLQPTSPLRTAEHIDEAISLISRKDANAVVSVTEVDHSPLWCNTLPEDGDMSVFIKDSVKNKRSQDFPPYYRLNGAIYIGKTDKVLNDGGFILGQNIFAYKMHKNVSIDVDDQFDFELCEFLLKS